MAGTDLGRYAFDLLVDLIDLGLLIFYSLVLLLQLLLILLLLGFQLGFALFQIADIARGRGKHAADEQGSHQYKG